jgi:septal ring factor EnvC (AmiA/AmiB activator)
MKRDFLKALGLEDSVIDKIMAENGSDIESHKAATAKVQSELDGLKTQLDGVNTQLTEAGKTIEGFKAMNIDQIKASADDWKTKAEKAEADRVAQLAALKFDHALEGALTGAKAKNAKAVRALLDQGAMKLNDDGSILGLKEQLEKVQSENAYLFDGEVTDPKIVDKTTTTTNNGLPAFAAAAAKIAGVKLD